ncbi:hypothetical protein J3R83DRAFT_1504 [Lanmaoa asiatica]|nr:hypothetical protein J3R83DRAFT_1504 [Lanmaoa asiatica]
MSEASIPRRDENERWKALIRESEATMEKYLVPEINSDLASFIRCITFRVFLVVFLRVDPDTLAFTNVQRVTEALLDFYDDRQGKSTLPLVVESILYQWLPREQFPTSLDRILPAYEALWRIIATIVVTCQEDSDEKKTRRWMMLDFRDNPRDRQYRASFGGDGKSVSTITNDAVGCLIPIARPLQATTSNWPLSCIPVVPITRSQQAITSDWLLSCIQYASGGSSTAEDPPTVQEALKFAALLASKVIGRIGVHYGISHDGVTVSQASPWDRRKIFGVNRVRPAHIAINAVDMAPHASTSKQLY